MVVIPPGSWRARRVRRAGASACLAAALANPVAATPGLPEVFARYARGEASLGEVEEARREFAARRSAEAVALAGEPGEGTGPGEGEGGEPGKGASPAPPEGTGKAAGILRWIQDIPQRFVRRFTADKVGFTAAGEAERFVESSPVPAYTGTASQREAESDVMRPILVTAQEEVNTVQGVLERVITFGGIAALTKALGGDAGAGRAIETAGKVLNRMGAEEKRGFAQKLGNSALGKSIAKALSGKPTTALGRLVKDEAGSNILVAVAASGLVSAFLDDGLDLDTLKDHLQALNAIEPTRTAKEEAFLYPAEAVALYHMDAKATKVFQALWAKATGGSGAVAGALAKAEGAISGLGARMVKKVPAHLEARAASFANKGSSLGFAGITGATQLSLQGISEAAFKAGTLGVLGTPLIYTGWKVLGGMEDGMYIAGSRSKIFARYDTDTNYYQRTGNKLRDAIEERKVATQDLWEYFGRFPMTNGLEFFMRFAGGYTGAVIASSIVAPVGIMTFGASLVISAIFSEGGVTFGRWLGAKVDTSEGHYARLREKNARAVLGRLTGEGMALPERARALDALAALDQERAARGIRTANDLEVLMQRGGEPAGKLQALADSYLAARQGYLEAMARTAAGRAEDFEALVKVNQANRRIKFVERLDDVRLVKKGAYVSFELPDGWSAHASPRYDFVDARGHRGVWDWKTGRLVDVGKVADFGGKRVAFVDDAGVAVADGVIAARGDDLERSPGNVHVTSNGIVLEKLASGSWSVRGYGGEYDLFLRGSGRRFSWDGKRYVEVKPGAAAQAQEDPGREALVAELVGSLAGRGKGPGRAGKRPALIQAMDDLSRLHSASGADLGARYTAVLDGR